MDTKYTYYVICDATCDYPDEQLKLEKQLVIIPMTYYMNGVLYDGATVPFLPLEEYYAQMKAGACPQTSLITSQVVRETCQPLLEQGYDVFYVSFSSALSGSYRSAVSAVNELKTEYPDRKIEVFDTRSATTGEGLVLYYLLRKREEGASFEQICEYADYLREHVVQLFMVDDLYHLARGGRISKGAAIAGTVINLKPVIKVDLDGTLKCTNSMTGRRLALKMLLSKMEQKIQGHLDENKIIMINYATVKDDALWLAEKIKSIYGKETIISTVGPIVGAHVGAGMVGLFFIGSDRL